MTYLFECKDCGAEFEIAADFSTIICLHPNCPTCKSENTKRKYTPTSFILKGKDFYKTANRNTESE
jgi:putative FmdB family regulatory protein